MQLIGNMCKNKLIIAAAGSGKTTHLVKEALKIRNQNVLITTFTEANEKEIRKKFVVEHGAIPGNIIIQTWFSFLIQHGVRPYQGGVFDERVNGLSLISGQSKKFTKETDIEKYYFDSNHKIYSDKLSGFVLKCNDKNSQEVIGRINRIFPNIFIDEVQDLAGYDLELLKLFFDSSSRMLLVGDPRQGTYSTNNSAKNKQFKKANIIYFFDNDEIQKNLEVNSATLKINFRSNQSICRFSNKIFPNHAATSSGQNQTTGHDGIFFVREQDIDMYFNEYPACVQLRDKVTEKRINKQHEAINFGNSKGLSFDRVLIYPTKPIMNWIKDNNSELKPTSRSKFYVAVTRARYSVSIVYNFTDSEDLKGVNKYIPVN